MAPENGGTQVEAYARCRDCAWIKYSYAKKSDRDILKKAALAHTRTHEHRTWVIYTRTTSYNPTT